MAFPPTKASGFHPRQRHNKHRSCGLTLQAMPAQTSVYLVQLERKIDLQMCIVCGSNMITQSRSCTGPVLPVIAKVLRNLATVLGSWEAIMEGREGHAAVQSSKASSPSSLICHRFPYDLDSSSMNSIVVIQF